MQLKKKIRKIYDKSRRIYGSPRIYQQLLRESYAIGKKRVERLMQGMSIQAVAKRKYQATTDSKHGKPVAENHLNRNFIPDKPNVSWVSRYHLHLDKRRLAISSDHHGSLFSQDHRLIITQQIN